MDRRSEDLKKIDKWEAEELCMQEDSSSEDLEEEEGLEDAIKQLDRLMENLEKSPEIYEEQHKSIEERDKEHSLLQRFKSIKEVVHIAPEHPLAYCLAYEYARDLYLTRVDDRDYNMINWKEELLNLLYEGLKKAQDSDLETYKLFEIEFRNYLAAFLLENEDLLPAYNEAQKLQGFINKNEDDVLRVSPVVGMVYEYHKEYDKAGSLYNLWFKINDIRYMPAFLHVFGKLNKPEIGRDCSFITQQLVSKRDDYMFQYLHFAYISHNIGLLEELIDAFKKHKSSSEVMKWSADFSTFYHAYFNLWHILLDLMKGDRPTGDKLTEAEKNLNYNRKGLYVLSHIYMLTGRKKEAAEIYENLKLYRSCEYDPVYFYTRLYDIENISIT